MQKLKFEIDWVDAERINGPELSATWASLRIYAGDSVITRVLDARAKTVRDFVYVPLYPLAEWLATNWWFLTQEINNPEKEDDPDFHRRHALSASREGYAFPDLSRCSPPVVGRALPGNKVYLHGSRSSSWTREKFRLTVVSSAIPVPESSIK